MLIPNHLQRGDKIGVVSPSSVISGETRPQLDNGIKFLESLGFRVLLGKNALKVDDYSAGTPEERAEDVNSMFANKETKAIICSQGGDTANSCLPFINWEIIKQNPKIFLGMSDNSVLLNTIYVKTGLVTFHGNDVMWGFGRNPTQYDRQEFVNRLIKAKIGKINKNSEWKTVRKGVVEGKLLGGNLRSLLKLAGTPYFPDFKNSILLVEAYEIKPEECDYMFSQLKQIGVFHKIKGVFVGYIYSLQTAQRIQMEDVILKVVKEFDFPILKSNDFGHNCPNTVLPIGVKVKLDADKKELEILDRYAK